MKKIINTTVALLGLAVFIASCSKIDDYKKYTAGGELVYPAKIDSLKMLSGKDRVMLKGVLTADPKIVKYRVFWNNRKDSVEVPVIRTNGVDSVKYIIPNLPEGPMSFEIHTYDAKGNASVPMYIIGNVYGERYRSGLNSRPILAFSPDANGTALAKMQDIPANSGVVALNFRYQRTDNTIADTTVVSQLKDQVVALPKFTIGTIMQFRTVNKPDSLCIDTFYSAYENISLKGEIALKNNVAPFKASQVSGRWGNLADWITNSAMKNQLSGLGGYATDDNGTFKFQTGWDDAKSINNGKIYQTLTLYPGKYELGTHLSEENDNGGDNLYIVATEGNEIDNVENLSSSLGSAKVKNSSFEFEITEKKTISVGLLVAKMEGYKYIKIDYIKLIMK